MPNAPLLVSSCLAGVACRYDGASKPDIRIRRLHEAGRCLLVCPEVLGGLSVPRPPCELTADGRVATREGLDCTAAYRSGAEKALAMAREAGAVVAVLKSRSPSCGTDVVYDGTFSRTLVPGQGVFAHLLREAGMACYSEENVPEEILSAGE